MSLLEECAILRADEWEAFKSIYPDSATRWEPCPEGTKVHLELPVELGQDHDLQINNLMHPETIHDMSLQMDHTSVAIRLTYLPPLLLTFCLPPLYPVEAGPSQLSLHAMHSWIFPSAQLLIKEALASRWDATLGEGVLWGWAEWIRSGEFLDTIRLREGHIIKLSHPAPELLAPTLQKHNSMLRNSEFTHGTYLCAICMNTQKGTQCLRLARCGHVFCRSCLKDFWGLMIVEGDVSRVTCADPDCVKKHMEVDEEDVRRTCGEDATERWKWLREKRNWRRVDPTIVFCPLQVCQAPVRKPKVEELPSDQENRWEALRTCSHCGLSFCVYCRRTWHGILTRCVFSQAQAFVPEYRKASKGSHARRAIEQRYGRANVLRLIAQQEEDEKNKEWLKQSTMPCPGCQVYVEKSFGCNHMTCVKCGCHYCFSCGNKVNAKDPYAHFNGGRSKCMLFDAKELREDVPWDPVLEEHQIMPEGPAAQFFGEPNWRRWQE